MALKKWVRKNGKLVETSVSVAPTKNRTTQPVKARPIGGNTQQMQKKLAGQFKGAKARNAMTSGFTAGVQKAKAENAGRVRSAQVQARNMARPKTTGSVQANMAKTAAAAKAKQIGKPVAGPTPKKPPLNTAKPKKSTFATVKSGDTLSAIAKRNGLTLSQFKALNKGRIKNANKIYSGQKYRVK